MRIRSRLGLIGLALTIGLATLAVTATIAPGGAANVAAPANLGTQAATCTGPNGINVWWSPSSFGAVPVHHYNLFHDGALLSQPGAGTTEVFDRTAPGDYHSYTVSAVDGNGHETARSAHASAIAVDCTRTPPRIGALRVAVFVVSGTATAKASAARALSVASDRYRQASWGQAWLTGDVFGPYTVGTIARRCDASTMFADARHAFGITHNEYDYFAIIGARCGSIGSPELGAFTDRSEYLAHELGHELGMYHASSSRCSVAALTDRTCKQWSEYGNRYDFMGGNRELNAPHMDSLGWLHFGGTSQVVTVNQTATFTIGALDVAPTAGDSAPRALKIVAGPAQVASYTQPSYVYVEFRRGAKGVLATQSHPAVAGYHAAPSAGRNFLLQIKGKGVLPPGTRLQFVRDGAPVMVEVLSVTNASAQVRVTIG